MNTFMNQPYIPQTVIDEENYIKEGYAKYGKEGFWKLIDELNKHPAPPYTIKLVRQTYPNLQ